jgi:hypothetical protein
LIRSLLNNEPVTSIQRHPKLFDEAFQADTEDTGGQLEDAEIDEDARPKQLFGLGGPYGYHQHSPFTAGYLDPSQLYQQYPQYLPEIDFQVLTIKS